VKTIKKTIKYTIFKTKTGYFAVLGTENALLKTILPVKNPKKAEFLILKDHPNAKFDKNYKKSIQNRIKAYFKGTYTDFTDIHVNLSALPPFTRKILQKCRKIKFSQTASYKKLAQMAGNPNAAQAVGNVLAKNPIPLIIPCHRIIKSDGRPGGFSAHPNKKMKINLLKLEK